jgi:glutamate formiminotransferase
MLNPRERSTSLVLATASSNGSPIVTARPYSASTTDPYATDDMDAPDLMLECVPNFSEGQRQPVIDQIAAEASRYAPLLDVHSDVDHNRSVLTLAGEHSAVVESILAAAEEAVRLIDMTTHSGVHPRLGAADVIPFVPLRDSSMDDAIGAALDCARRIHESIGIPVFLYGAASPGKRGLPEIRRNAFASLAPDFGTAPHPTAGAAVIGARGMLVAYNVNLSAPLEAASRIARSIRESDGGLRSVRALAFPLASRELSQVSTNLIRPADTTLADVYDAVDVLCREMGIEIADAELVGLAPRAAFDGREPESLGLKSKAMILEDQLASTDQ